MIFWARKSIMITLMQYYIRYKLSVAIFFRSFGINCNITFSVENWTVLKPVLGVRTRGQTQSNRVCSFHYQNLVWLLSWDWTFSRRFLTNTVNSKLFYYVLYSHIVVVVYVVWVRKKLKSEMVLSWFYVREMYIT